MKHLKQRISWIYYNHGLFCATHPIQVIVCVCVIVFVLCLPLFQLPLIKHVPIDHLILHERDYPISQNSHSLFIHTNPNKSLGYSLQLVFHTQSPETTSTTDCLHTSHQAFLDLLEQSAKIIQIIQQYRSYREEPGGPHDGRSFEDICFQVEDRIMLHPSNTDSSFIGHLPTFGCLLLAPSMLWADELGQIRVNEASDFNNRFIQAKRSHLRDLFFGLPWQLTGISENVVCDQPYSLSFVITLVFREYDQVFIDGLRSHLVSFYPRTVNVQPISDTNPPNTSSGDHQYYPVNRTASESEQHQQSNNRIYLVWYRGRSYLSDCAPLLLIYLVLLLYVYFSVSKLEMVKSKWGLAFSACCTVVASLCMSLSLCIRIGLMVPTLNRGEIFPYLVVFIGFENVIILTKSVVATPIDLPVKYRIAQGLSKESWPLTKHYLTQLLLLGLGFFTFHPTMQEFCLFAMIGVTTDFFLQLFFFATVLSIDIRRMESTDITTQYGSNIVALTDTNSLLFPDVYVPASDASGGAEAGCGCTGGFIRWNNPSNLSHTLTSHGLLVPLIQRLSMRLHNMCLICKSFFRFCWLKLKRSPYQAPNPRPGHKRRVSAAEAAAFLSSDEKPTANVPRRLWLLRSLANHRVVQRLFIFIVALWIILIGTYTIYRAQHVEKDLVATLHTPNGKLNTDVDQPARPPKISDEPPVQFPTDSRIDHMIRRLETSGLVNSPHRSSTQLTFDVNVLWDYLAFSQWPSLALYYNLTLAGSHLTILEPIHLHHSHVPKSGRNVQTNLFHDKQMISENEVPSGPDFIQYDYNFLWSRVSQLSLDQLWPVQFSRPAAEDDRTEATSKHDGERFVGFADEFLQPLSSNRPLPLLPSPPGGAAGFKFRLSLTFSMLSTSFLGCSFVLLATCLGMVCFQELQSKSSVQIHREPVIRVLPLTISLSEDDGGVYEEVASVQDPLAGFNSIEWTVACGTCALGPSGSMADGIIAACGLRCRTIDSRFAFSPTDTIQCWSTHSGLALPSVHRYSTSAMTVRRNASAKLHRLCRRRSTVWTMCFLPNGLLAAGCSDGAVEIWNCQLDALQYLLFVTDLKLDSTSLRNSTGSAVGCPKNHPGGITTHLVVDNHSLVVGTSRGLIAWFDLSVNETIAIPTRQWPVHSRSITQLIHSSFAVPTASDQSSTVSLVVSGAEDGYISIIQLSSDEPVYCLSLEPTAVVSLDMSNLFLASSHVSGSLYSLRFRATLTEDIQPTIQLESMEAATRLAVSSNGNQSKSASPYAHLGTIGLKWFPTSDAIQIGSDGSLTPCAREFRLISCELDGYLAIWNLDPISLVRTFRMNLSTISPSNPIIHMDDRVIFGDQSYLRVVNPWTAKYERSVHLIPPSTVLFRNKGNHLSSNILSSVLQKWSKQLVPLGVTGLSSNAPLHPTKRSSSDLYTSGSFMVSLADSGRTLVIAPLTTIKPQ